MTFLILKIVISMIYRGKKKSNFQKFLSKHLKIMIKILKRINLHFNFMIILCECCKCDTKFLVLMLQFEILMNLEYRIFHTDE